MYFGELALLRSEPRAATVTALTDCDLLELGRADFMALMGPLAKILEAHTARYGLNFSAKKASPATHAFPSSSSERVNMDQSSLSRVYCSKTGGTQQHPSSKS